MSASVGRTASKCSPRGEDCGGLPPKTKMPPCGTTRTTYKAAFSKDPQQKYLFVADGTNDHVWVLDRNSGKTPGSFGGNGKYAGQFHWINAMGTDSKGGHFHRRGGRGQAHPEVHAGNGTCSIGDWSPSIFERNGKLGAQRDTYLYCSDRRARECNVN
jgi:hypothetical protein